MKPERKLDVRLEGPAAQGRLSVDYLATLVKELQSTLRRIAKNRPTAGGRPGKEIEEACRLELVSFKPGSVQLGFELAATPSQTLFGEMGEDSMARLVLALERGQTGQDDWCSDLPPPALDGLEKITKPLEDGITAMRFTTFGRGRRCVVVTESFRNRLRSITCEKPAPGTLRITGVVWEADWKKHSAERSLVGIAGLLRPPFGTAYRWSHTTVSISMRSPACP